MVKVLVRYLQLGSVILIVHSLFIIYDELDYFFENLQ